MRFRSTIILSAVLLIALALAAPAFAGGTRASGTLGFGPTTYGVYFWYDLKVRDSEKAGHDGGRLRFWTSYGDEWAYRLSTVTFEGDKVYMYGPLTSTNTGVTDRWTYAVLWDRGTPDPNAPTQYVPDLLFEQQVASEAQARAMYEQRYIPHYLLASSGDIKFR